MPDLLTQDGDAVDCDGCHGGCASTYCPWCGLNYCELCWSDNEHAGCLEDDIDD